MALSLRYCRICRFHNAFCVIPYSPDIPVRLEHRNTRAPVNHSRYHETPLSSPLPFLGWSFLTRYPEMTMHCRINEHQNMP